MENQPTLFDVVTVFYQGQTLRGVVLGKDVDFKGDSVVPIYELLLEPRGERATFHDSELSVEGKLHTPFTWRDMVHVKPEDNSRERFYGSVSGISWSPESQEWWFSVIPIQGDEAEMFAERELTAVSMFDFAK